MFYMVSSSPRGEDTRKRGVSVKIYINFYTKIADYDLLAVFILGGGRQARVVWIQVCSSTGLRL